MSIQVDPGPDETTQDFLDKWYCCGCMLVYFLVVLALILIILGMAGVLPPGYLLPRPTPTPF